MAELVKDLNNHYFIIVDEILTDNPSMQHARGTRIPITGTGQLEAARELYGRERTNADLTNYYETPQAAVDYFGGPGEMERVVAGEKTDPITGERVQGVTREDQSTDDTGEDETFIGGPESDVTFEEVQEAAREDRSTTEQERRERERKRRERELEQERQREQERMERLVELERERRQEEREKQQRNARAILNSYLQEWGLENLTDNVWDSVKRGAQRAEIVQEIRDTDEYANRFPGIMQQRANNFPVMSENEYLESETSIVSTMRSAGMPRGFYDDREQIGELLGQHISPREVNRRVREGWREVMNAPQEVRDEFRAHLGVNGDQALATYFVDPDRASDILLDEVERAFIGGHASRFDFDITEDRVGELHSLGIDREAARRGFAELAQQRRAGIFRETIGERDQDLRVRDEGIAAMFEQDPDAIHQIERRGQQRTAAFSGLGSRPQVTQGGTGLGSAGSRTRISSGFGGFGGR